MEKDRLIFTINRYDHFYDSVNNKGNVILGLSTFITGATIVGYPTLSDLEICSMWVRLNLIAVILFGVASIATLLLASVPYLTQKSNSLFYFGSVSSLTSGEFKEASSAMNEESELEDLREQAFLLASGLTGKFKKLKTATILNLIQIGLLVPLTIFLIYHLK